MALGEKSDRGKWRVGFAGTCAGAILEADVKQASACQEQCRVRVLEVFEVVATQQCGAAFCS